MRNLLLSTCIFSTSWNSPKKKHELQINITVKPVLSSHSKEDRFVFKIGNRLIQVESIAECSR